MSKKSRSAPTGKHYAWMIGLTAAIAALVILIPTYGAVIQVGLVFIMPTVVIGASIYSFLTEVERIVAKVQGVELPNDVRVHPRHVWAKKTAAKVVVAGVDDFAQRLLGKVEAIETKRVGAKVEVGEVIATLKHGDRALSVHAPIAGTIAFVNPAVESDPSIINRSCYERGWIVELTPAPDFKASFAKLLGRSGAVTWMRDEVEKLVALAAPARLAPADGGDLGKDVSGKLDEETWRKVNGAFFA